MIFDWIEKVQFTWYKIKKSKSIYIALIIINYNFQNKIKLINLLISMFVIFEEQEDFKLKEDGLDTYEIMIYDGIEELQLKQLAFIAKLSINYCFLKVF